MSKKVNTKPAHKLIEVIDNSDHRMQVAYALNNASNYGRRYSSLKNVLEKNREEIIRYAGADVYDELVKKHVYIADVENSLQNINDALKEISKNVKIKKPKADKKDVKNAGKSKKV